MNLWSSFRGTPPQRRARLYTTLVERAFASSVSGALLPTREPFLYTLSLTAMEGVTLDALEQAVVEQIERVRRQGVSNEEVARGKRQLRARIVFETDSVTNIAHQIGYFETVTGPGVFETLAHRIEAVTPEQVSAVARARLTREKCTVGLFRPLGAAA